jgi:hypothetical protein
MAVGQVGQAFGQLEADHGKVIRGKVANTGGELQSSGLGHGFNP